MSIKIKFLENNKFIVNYNGNRTLHEFNAYANVITSKLIEFCLPNTNVTGGWIFHYSKLDLITDTFSDITYVNEYIAPPYINMGKDMKLQPYEYQKEAIHFAIHNLNSLMVLPCGSGN